MKVVFIGDVCYKSGRQILKDRLPSIIERYEAGFCVVNGENSAGGKGINGAIAGEIYDAGADVITSGNHIWARNEIYHYIDSDKNLIRPLNYSNSGLGRGVAYIEKKGSILAVANISGRVFMDPCDCPFKAMEEALPSIKEKTKTVIVDFHGEASSEKAAFAWHFDGRVSAVIGTHTHVQTADERILPFGTALITDAGMTGPYEGIIGTDRELIINKFVTGLPAYFKMQKGRAQLNGVFLELDENTGKCLRIERILEIEE